MCFLIHIFTEYNEQIFAASFCTLSFLYVYIKPATRIRGSSFADSIVTAAEIQKQHCSSLNQLVFTYVCFNSVDSGPCVLEAFAYKVRVIFSC